jgi:hypothetical protein
LLTVALVVALFACGGGHNVGCGDPGNGNGGNQTPVPHVVMGALPGTHIFAAKKTTTTAFDFSLLPRVYAQTTSVALTQSWNGVCNLSPDAVGALSGAVYRLGQDLSQNCSQLWFNDDAHGTQAAANAQAGQLVIGNGTAGNLVAWTSKGTVIQEGVEVHLYVRRNGATTDTNINCVIAPGSDYLKCSSGATFQLLDGDLAIATFTKGANDKFVGLNVVFTKTL